jgi:hypothetical protein
MFSSRYGVQLPKYESIPYDGYELRRCVFFFVAGEVKELILAHAFNILVATLTQSFVILTM